MSDQAGYLEVPAIGPGGVLRVSWNEYGDYCNFQLVRSSDDGEQLAATLFGYAVRIAVATHGDDPEIGFTSLVVGNASVFLPWDSGQLLAEFLGVPLEKKQLMTGEER